MKVTQATLHPLTTMRRHQTISALQARHLAAGAPDQRVPATRSYFLLLALHTDDGLTGYGEVSDADPARFDRQAVAQRIGRAVLGADPFDLERVMTGFAPAPGSWPGFLNLDTSVGCAVDNALYDLQGKALGVPVYQLLGVETPIDRRNVVGIARIRQAVDTPIMEHIFHDLRYAINLVRHEAVDVFNVASSLCGGITRARRAIAIAESAGIRCLLGSTVELGAGTAAQLHLGASCPAVDLPSDLIGPQMYTEDYVTRPFAYDHGALTVSDGPGLGIEVDPARLERMTWRPDLPAGAQNSNRDQAARS